MLGYIFLLSIFFVGVNPPESASSPWKKVKENNGIIVYTKNSDSTNLKVVKITTRVQATLSSLVELVKDADNQKNWAYLSKNNKILKVYSPTHWIFYGQTNVPWPIEDRDVVTDVVLKQDSITKAVSITSHSIKGYYPVQKDFVRIPFVRTQWCFIPQSDGSIQLTLTVVVDVGGHIPLWLMRLTAVKGPYSTIKNFLEQLKKEKYAHKQHSFISEPHL